MSIDRLPESFEFGGSTYGEQLSGLVLPIDTDTGLPQEDVVIVYVNGEPRTIPRVDSWMYGPDAAGQDFDKQGGDDE